MKSRILLNQFILAGLLYLLLMVPAHAAPSITLGAGVVNPPPNLASTGLNPKQIAVADTATLVSAANFTNVLQATLNAQGFTAANNWTLVNNAVALADNTKFNITNYSLSLNGTGTKFGETMDFTLNPNPAAPTAPAGSTVTEHWLQILNEDQKYGGFGYAIAGQNGFWQLDNGDKAGGAAAGAGTGPYYDSNAAGGGFSVPPTFHDFPHYYSGVGTYLHFTAIPTWDIYTPAAGGKAASETIDVGSYGIAYGFQINASPAPEAEEWLLLMLGLPMIGWVTHRKHPGINEANNQKINNALAI
ncbi:hypothetical protein [Methylomonas sp. AM2-LC]|uniref:hypothetical protein n=1 Tax=Methylomonas sp. AM2-LC TaxID=3153301 RepID=UPI003264B744